MFGDVNVRRVLGFQITLDARLYRVCCRDLMTRAQTICDGTVDTDDRRRARAHLLEYRKRSPFIAYRGRAVAEAAFPLLHFFRHFAIVNATDAETFTNVNGRSCAFSPRDELIFLVCNVFPSAASG